MGWRGDLPPQGGLVSRDEAGVEAGKRGGEGGHLDVVGILDGRVGRNRRYPGTKEEELKPGPLTGYILKFKISVF